MELGKSTPAIFRNRILNSTMPRSQSEPTGLTDLERMKRSIDLSFGLIVMLVNIAEIIIIARIKKKLKYELLILSLCVTDMLFGLSNSVVSCIYLSQNAQNEEVLEITYTTYFYFVLNSILHLIWIAIDRLWAVCKPLQHKVIMTKKKIYIIIGITWLVSTVTAVSLFVADEMTEAFTQTELSVTYENVTINDTDASFTTTSVPFTSQPIAFIINASVYSLQKSTITPKTPKYRLVSRIRVTTTNRYHKLMALVLSIFILIADVILLFVYVIIIYLIRKKGKVPLKSNSETEDRVSIICLLIAGSFILFTLPYAIARLAIENVPLWANLILLSNSGMNSILYFFRGRCEKWQSKLEKKSQGPAPSSTLSTPVSTPYQIRKGYNSSPRVGGGNKLTTQM